MMSNKDNQCPICNSKLKHDGIGKYCGNRNCEIFNLYIGVAS